MRNENVTYISAQSMTSTINGNPINLENMYGYAFQLVWTGTPVGNFTLQASNDPGTVHSDNTITGITNWITISGTTVAAGGAAGSQMYNVDSRHYKWVRLVYTASSSTGTLNVQFQADGSN